MDERIRRIVHSQPIPMRLVTAIDLAPVLSVNQTPSRVLKALSHGGLDPDNLRPIMLRTLTLICHGYSDLEIAKRTTP